MENMKKEAGGQARTFFVETYGCQMNFSDSELVEGLLSTAGLVPAGSLEEADIVLVNTCGVRDHAEQRVIGRLGQLRALKDGAPGKILAVIGCMAQRIGEQILERAPWVDLAVGPDSYRRLPELIAELSLGGGVQLAQLEFDSAETYADLRPLRQDSASAWVPITRGCDNYCTYCIVPYVRGRERSVDPDTVEAWVRREVKTGAVEVVLLGQNVNSYRHGDMDFAGLLRRLQKVEGLAWIRFLTSHPRDLSDSIIRAMAECSKVCEHLHLPVQSGSNRVLERMNRGYSREYYLERVAFLREAIPGIGLTTDVLVGFPGETEEDFAQTVSLMEEVEFDYAFTFRYSPRPGTVAERSEDDVPDREKARRLDTVIQLQRSQTRATLDRLTGQVFEVLPIKEAKTGRGRLQGRTRTHFDIFITAPVSAIGRVAKARITGNTGMNLLGELTE